MTQERFTIQNMAYTQLFVDYLHKKDPLMNAVLSYLLMADDFTDTLQ